MQSQEAGPRDDPFGGRPTDLCLNAVFECSAPDEVFPRPVREDEDEEQDLSR